MADLDTGWGRTTDFASVPDDCLIQSEVVRGSKLKSSLTPIACSTAKLLPAKNTTQAYSRKLEKVVERTNSVQCQLDIIACSNDSS